VIEAVLAGEQSIHIITGARPIAAYVDDRTFRLNRILEKIKTDLLRRYPFEPYYKAVFEILHHLECQGIRLEGVEGSDGSCIVLNGTLKREVGKIPSGTDVEVRVDKSLRRDLRLHNSPTIRNAFNAQLMQDLIRGSKNWSELFPQPVLMLFGGRSFIGHTNPKFPNPSRQVVAFSIFKKYGGGFEDACTRLADQWHEHGTVSNDLLNLVLQPLLLSLYHAHKHGFLNRNITPKSIGHNADGKVVFRDMTHGWCAEPKSSDAFRIKNTPLGCMLRNSTHAPNPKGPSNESKPLFQVNGQRNGTELYKYFTRLDFNRAAELSRNRGRGLGRLGDGNLNFYDRKAAEERAKAVKRDPEVLEDRKENEAGDCFEASRLILQIFNKVDREDPQCWEEQATAATADGDAEKVLEFMERGTRATPCQQRMTLLRFAVFFARTLGPQEQRPSLTGMMTDPAATLPILPPEDEQAVLGGTGIVFPGGVAGRVYPGINKDWKEYHIPATSAQIETTGPGRHIGLGLVLSHDEGVKRGDFVSFYPGTKRSAGSGQGPMDIHPSRFGVSVSSKEQTDNVSIDGFTGRKLTLEWLKTHQATGVFMNAGDWKGGPRSNVTMDRHKAWTDPATGIVWIPMYASRDIAPGEFLRWKYNPTDGEAGIYNFKDEDFSRG
jgi:hypothetical protein